MKFEEAVKHLKQGKCIKKENSLSFYKFDGVNVNLVTDKGEVCNVCFSGSDVVANDWEIRDDCKISLHSLLQIFINFSELFNEIHIDKSIHKAKLIVSSVNAEKVRQLLFPNEYVSEANYNYDIATYCTHVDIYVPFKE